MARRVRTKWRWLKKNHPTIYSELADSKGMTSSRALNRLKKHKIKPVITLNKLRQLAYKREQGHNIPIKVTRDMPRGYKYADGVAIRERTGEVHVKLHPVLRYHDRRYISDVMGHELDHARFMGKVVKRHRKSRG